MNTRLKRRISIVILAGIAIMLYTMLIDGVGRTELGQEVKKQTLQETKQMLNFLKQKQKEKDHKMAEALRYYMETGDKSKLEDLSNGE